jgi:hypothetical protein
MKMDTRENLNNCVASEERIPPVWLLGPLCAEKLRRVLPDRRGLKPTYKNNTFVLSN